MRGLRCQVCTGCGLCPGVSREAQTDGIHILTGEDAGGRNLDLRNREGFRLVAIDIGTTTIAMELYECGGAVMDTFVTVNPQVKHGSDVLSRIVAARDETIRTELMELVKSALIQGLKRFLKCLRQGEKMVATIAANTTMSYLLMGWDPGELGVAPFHASRLRGASFTLSLEEQGAEEVPCVLLPGISAFVGSDILAGIHFCGMAKKEEVTLLIDLGTNGEMALGNRERILCTATAAGPAFEGGASRGIWGADMVRFLATLLRMGFLDETGLLREPYFTRGIRIGNVTVTKEAVRSLQLAKAAIAAGILILTKEYGISVSDIERVVLAGGFGYYLQPGDAAMIGMFPEKLQGRTVSGGNTALLGAKTLGAILLNEGTDDQGLLLVERLLSETDQILSKTKTLNLAAHPDFAEGYVKAMELKAT